MSYGNSGYGSRQTTEAEGPKISRDAQAIDRLVDLGALVEKSKFNVITKNDHFVIPQADGTVKCTPVPREPVHDREYRAETLDGFLSSIATLAASADVREVRGDSSESEKPAPALFVGSNRLVFVFDERSRRDAITFDLERTPEWGLLNSGIKGGQADFCHALQLHFYEAIQPTTFLPMVKAVKFRTEEQTSQATAVSRNSIDQSILRELAGMREGDVPDFVDLKAQVYSNAIPDFKPTIRTMFVVDFVSKKFSLTAMPSSLHAACEEAMRKVSELVRAKGLPEHIRIVEGVAPNV